MAYQTFLQLKDEAARLEELLNSGLLSVADTEITQWELDQINYELDFGSFY